VRGLRENGLNASGWDPYYAPDNPIQAADIVNLGFVINVIEDFDERLDALTRAWSLAERLLVVSVMLANQNDPRGERFRDGVMTQRGTFQKYFSQSEIKAFLEQVLDEEAIPVAPGVLYVFRDKDAEQRFLVDRYRSKSNRLRGPSPRPRQREQRIRPDRGRSATTPIGNHWIAYGICGLRSGGSRTSRRWRTWSCSPRVLVRCPGLCASWRNAATRLRSSVLPPHASPIWKSISR
jgi:hypothetical protein